MAAKGSLSAVVWLTKSGESGEPSPAQAKDSPLPQLSLRILLISSAAALGLHSPPTFGNGNGDSPPLTQCSRAGCMEKIHYFHLCDCILPFDALDVYFFIMY